VDNTGGSELTVPPVPLHQLFVSKQTLNDYLIFFYRIGLDFNFPLVDRVALNKIGKPAHICTPLLLNIFVNC
jgi:hypothetical protein